MPNDKRPLYIPFAGQLLMSTPLLNKGSAFTDDERKSFNLEGLLPEATETIHEQVSRAYKQFSSHTSDMDKHVYLRNIQDTNETLFYHLVQNYITEMMPIIYTPTVGAACENFSNIYRRGRGLFVSYPNRGCIDDLINNAATQNVKVIVVTDGERILGLGDQGIGGMGIPIGKLSLYTACGGISPAYCLPIILDVGTNNAERLADPMYMGWRNPRIVGPEYDRFVDDFMQAIKRRFPNALVQFEDFAQNHAMPLLERYKDQMCCFNDDIQGTAAVVSGSLIAALRGSKQPMKDQRIVIVGAGSAGCGIAESIIDHLEMGSPKSDNPRAQLYMVDRHGLLHDGMTDLIDFQQPLAHQLDSLVEWSSELESGYSLLDVIKNAKPTVIIGASGIAGLFSKEVIQEMHKHCAHPIVFPLSNPTSRAEAKPADILTWTNGTALVATGSPFPPVEYNGKIYPIAQCNNSYIFPGIGLGVLAVSASRVTNNMLMAASRALASCSPLTTDRGGALLPPLEDIHCVSKTIAYAVASAAIEDDVALGMCEEAIIEAIDNEFWLADYRDYKRSAF